MAAWAVIAGCGSSESSDRFVGASLVTSTERASPTTTMIVDESFPEFTSSADFSTGTFQHACGAFALVQNSLDISLLQAVDGRWQTVEGPSFALPEPAELADHRLMDVTGDGQPEVIMVWYPEFSSHTYGHVLTADSTNCVWGYAPIVRGCGADSLTADLEIEDSGEMSTFEFLACWGGYRDTLPMVWIDEFGVFLTEPPSDRPIANRSPTTLSTFRWVCAPVVGRLRWVRKRLQAKASTSKRILVSDREQGRRRWRISG